MGPDQRAQSDVRGDEARGPEPKFIQGILKDDGQRVLLLNVFKGGGHFSTYGISHEKFSAINCLVGNKAVPTDSLLLHY